MPRARRLRNPLAAGDGCLIGLMGHRVMADQCPQPPLTGNALELVQPSIFKFEA